VTEGPEDVDSDTEIRPLDPDTVAQIAAGEVVERPASVVKELLENALDAGAERVAVAVEDGGLQRVEVQDDGRGMNEADLRAAVREHTTSKLEDAAELSAVETLGFRGEALHTIGAVADLEIVSRPNPDAGPGEAEAEGGAGGAPTGTRLHYRGGDVEAVEAAAHPGGTTVTVTDLFYNTPARRKYLAERATEFRHVSRVVGRYALANPMVAITLSHDGREVFSTTGDGDRRAAIMAVYGREVAESMIAVDVAPETDAVERIDGFVSEPETTRASREYLATYVNGRAVADDAVRGAIVEGYGGQLAADRYPFAVCFLSVPPERVDVNVHPRKQAVRFDDEAAVADAVSAAVREALLEAGIVRASAPRGVSAPEETPVRPGADDAGRGQSADAPDTGDETESPSPSARSTDDRSPEVDGEAVAPSAEEASTSADSPPSRPTEDPGSSAGVDTGTRHEAEVSETIPPGTGTDTERDSEVPGDPARSATPQAADWTQRLAGPVDPVVEATDQRTLDGDAVSERSTEFDRLPPLRVLGQHADTYVVAEGPEGLLVVDQHAADERIHYERLREAVDTGTAQALADPVELSLTPAEAETYDDYAPALRRLGFHTDRDGRTLEVRSVPTVLGETLSPAAIRDVFGALLEGADGEGTVEAMADELLGDLACAPAVTGNTSLTEGSVTALLEALDDCENPFECPHGRPTILRIDGDELAERFERDYPGHGTRPE